MLQHIKDKLAKAVITNASRKLPHVKINTDKKKLMHFLTTMVAIKAQTNLLHRVYPLQHCRNSHFFVNHAISMQQQLHAYFFVNFATCHDTKEAKSHVKMS